MRQQVETSDDPILREMVRATTNSAGPAAVALCRFEGGPRDDDDASRRRAAWRPQALREGGPRAAGGMRLRNSKPRSAQKLHHIEVATGDVREGLTLLMEDCSEAAAPAAAPESRRLDALADLQTEMAAVANGADASKIKRKFRAYVKRARLAHRDEVEQELGAQIKKSCCVCRSRGARRRNISSFR